MKILVVSDLHIGIKARTRELDPYPEGINKDTKLVSAFLDYTKNYQRINGNFDFIIIPGDITHQSNLIEYDCGQLFLKKVMLELGIYENKIIFVPGNHDVDWSVLEGVNIRESEKILRKKHKYNTLNDKRHLFSTLTTNDLVEFPYIKTWEFDNAVFVGFNSSWHDDSLHKSHYGLIEREQIELLRDKLNKINFENKLKIFVVHHHVYQLLNPHSTWVDTSSMQNAQPLIELLSEFSFNLVVHGHRHVPFFVSTTIENFQPINILCSGSYSCEVPTEISGSVGNLFHIIEIDDEEKCKGRVLSLAYNPIKYTWVNSKENYGIEYENPFGIEIKYDDLIEQCIEIVNKILESENYFEYEELINKIPELKYISSRANARLISDIETIHNLKSSIADDTNVVFIKRKGK